MIPPHSPSSNRDQQSRATVRERPDVESWGHGGGEGWYSRLQPNPEVSLPPGGLQGLGSCQSWHPPWWWNLLQLDVARVVAWLYGHALTALRQSKQEFRLMLCGGTGGRSAWGTGQTVELGAVHCLSEGDSATSPTCHRIPSNLTEDREANWRLGGRVPQDVDGGYPAHVRTITSWCLQRGVRGVQG